MMAVDFSVNLSQFWRLQFSHSEGRNLQLHSKFTNRRPIVVFTVLNGKGALPTPLALEPGTVAATAINMYQTLKRMESRVKIIVFTRLIELLLYAHIVQLLHTLTVACWETHPPKPIDSSSGMQMGIAINYNGR